MSAKKSTRQRRRRKDKRVVDVGLGRKKVSEGLTEEIVEEAFDWVERGGPKRILSVLKVVAAILAFALLVLIVYLVEVSK